MFITKNELETHFESLGYTLEITNQFVAFHKDNKYITLLPNEIVGTVEGIQQEVENRFEAGRLYAASQTE